MKSRYHAIFGILKQIHRKITRFRVWKRVIGFYIGFISVA